MTNFRSGQSRGSRLRLRASIVALVVLLPLLAAVHQAAPASAVGSLVVVTDASLTRASEGIVVSATIAWNDEGVAEHRMDVGDIRLVAVSERGHLPFVLARATHSLTNERTRSVVFTLTDAESVAAMRHGNRVVLTASQHQAAGQVTRSDRTYVTVAEVQPFGSPQPNIGRRDCSAVLVVPGAMLRHCDLVGAYLDGALVSIHDPKANNCKVAASSTCLERADLTGATAVRSDFSGANIAGGRLNGIDLSSAKLDNFYIAGAEAREITARGATSDSEGRDSGANMFAANLTGADLRETTFLGVSISQARLDNAKLQGARWESIADGASLRGADLTGANLGQSKVDWVDFTGATLTGSSLTDLQLAWTWLCRTALPEGSQSDGSRDCQAPVEAARTPIALPDQDTPFVAVDGGTLDDGPGPRTVHARVSWHVESALTFGMSKGTVRVLAVDATTGVPTLINATTTDDVTAPLEFDLTIRDKARLSAMSRGSRVVLTATQHQPRARSGGKTVRTYVTVAVLQAGRGLGRVGNLDCSRVAITADSARALDFCDLSGAMLDTAALNGRSMREVNLTGATAQDARMVALSLAGSRLGGLAAPDASLVNVSMFDALAPSMDLSSGSVVGSPLYPRTLDGGDFTGATMTDSPLATASLRGTDFSNARLIHPDLAFTDLSRSQLDGVDASSSSPSLFLANLTGADLSGSVWNVDESGDHPAQWATLCRTKVSDARFGIDGDRDCPS